MVHASGRRVAASTACNRAASDRDTTVSSAPIQDLTTRRSRARLAPSTPNNAVPAGECIAGRHARAPHTPEPAQRGSAG